MRIAILGIGGVGGYLGGKLASANQNSPKAAEIIFIARGKQGEVLSHNGLKLLLPNEELIVFPDLVSDDAEKIGPVDLMIICTKTYHLESALQAYSRCIKRDTILLPFLNGVNHSETISEILPDARIWKGCIYINSKVIEPGIVTVSEGIREIYFGANNESPEKLRYVEQLFQQAKIEARLRPDIDEVTWKKFAFIASMSALTSALDISIGVIRENNHHLKTLQQLINEVIELAHTLDIHISASAIFENALKVMQSFPYETTSSLHRDLRAGKPNELKALAGYIVEKGKEKGIDTRAFQNVYDQIKARWQLQASD